MRIVEQVLRATEPVSIIHAEYPGDCLFQLFVKGRLQDRRTYTVDGQHIDLGFDGLVPGDLVQIFYFIP